MSLRVFSAVVWGVIPVLAPPVSAAFAEVEGQVISQTAYKSNSEEHVLLQTESGYYLTRPDPKDPEYVHQNKEIHVYDYPVQGKTPGPLKFKLFDYVHDCIAAARLDFTKDSPLVTDLDKDGVKEVWISYYKGCHGDVSPDELKIFMYLDGVKHAIRGKTHVFVDGNFYGGDYKLDDRMQHADHKFRNFGEHLFRRLAEDCR